MVYTHFSKIHKQMFFENFISKYKYKRFDTFVFVNYYN